MVNQVFYLSGVGKPIVPACLFFSFLANSCHSLAILMT